MIYTGEIKNGVIVLKDAPQLEEGSIVNVEVKPPARPSRGSAEAVLKHAGAWADSAAEMDDALEYIRKTKWEEVRRQQSEPDPGL